MFQMNQILRKGRNFRLKLLQLKHSIKHMSNENYRLIYQSILFTASFGSGAAYLAFNTLGLDKYKSLVQMYTDGKGAQLNDKLELLALRVWNEAHVARKHKLMDLIQFFPSIGSEPFSAGALENRTGAIIGLPYNFTFETIEDVKTVDMQFLGQHDPYMKWQSEAGKQLIESLVLSEKAKKFAIAREIHITNTFRTHFNTMNACFGAFTSIALGQTLINVFNLPRILSMRLIVRMLSVVIGVSLWALVNEIFEYNWNVNADEAAVKQGSDYFEGAVEYYDKLRRRNAALYHLLGDRGKSMFTAEGDVKRLLFGTRKIPNIKQLDQLNDKKDQSKTNSETLVSKQ